MNQYLVGFIIFVFVAVALVKFLEGFVRGRSAEFSYERIEKLFSPAERSFLGVLEQVVGPQYRIFGKVGVGDIIRPRKGLSKSAFTTARNRIAGKHVDFAVCDSQTLRVIGVIELDDLSHGSVSQRKRDKVKDSTLAAAGVPIVRITAQRSYVPAEIREKMSTLFGRTE